MTPLPAPLRWLHSLEWRRGFFDWARSDGVTWVYIFKVLIAAFLTLWLAMRLELPQPRTAMITVFIVMQPQSGQVFAKSFYRFLGTLAGSAVMVFLIALFAQNTELFLGSLAIWVGICTAGATRNRNFRAYGFVLAGYTAAMVGLPALAHPDGAFMAAVWRVLEISLGIVCSTLVSAAILPQTSSAAMRNALYQRFGVFALFVTDGLRGRSEREGFEKTADYLHRGLTEQGYTVDVAREGVEGLHLALENDYAVIVLDVMLPGLDGFGVLRALRARKQTPVIMLTARERVEDRIRGLREGADDYLGKPFSFLELVARLQALTRRSGGHEPVQVTIADLWIDLISRKASRNGVRLDLTAKEFSLLSVLARRQGEILSKTSIAEMVWDINFDSDANVVEVAIKRLRAKLDGPFEQKLLHTIRGMGYVLENRSVG